MELFIKRFIDLLDEVAPVSMVHTIIEQPLGAIINESYVKIHARADLADEDSPFIEIELHPTTYDEINILYAYTYPISGISVTQAEFLAKINNINNVFAEQITPLNSEELGYYELFIEEEIKVSKNQGELDKQIHDIILVMMSWLTIGGYKIEKED